MAHRLATWIMATFLRWFGHRESTGLLAIGRPGPESPVLVTANFTLTVARVRRRLRGLDVWLLVVPSKGINVWCAACGGELTEHQVIGAVKTSRLAEHVTHRELLLPALAAPGVDTGVVREGTGFHVSFGPVRAADIPAYLADGAHRKTEAMKRFHPGLLHRLDMILSMNVVIWLVVALPFAIAWPHHLTRVSLLFWSLVVGMYVLFPWLPGRTGWGKSLSVMAAVVVGFATAGLWSAGDIVAYWPWMGGGVVMTVAVAFDAAGIVAALPSDALALTRYLGLANFGNLLSEQAHGAITFARPCCLGCGTCEDICPLGVFDMDDAVRKAVLARPELCFECGACVKQCPTEALSFTTAAPTPNAITTPAR